MVNSFSLGFVPLLALMLLATSCGQSDGSSGSPPVVRVSGDPDCIPILGKFPSGFDLLPGDLGHAVAAQADPADIIFVDLNGEAPQMLPREALPFPTDTDGDGNDDDAVTLCAEDFFDPSGDGRFAVLGRPLGVSEELAFVAASDYEEVLFVGAPDRVLREFLVSNPATPPGGDYFGEDYPFLPAPGQSAIRTAVSTRACVYVSAESQTSTDTPVGNQACCDRVPGAQSFFTRFTAGMALAAGRLFVATSNFDSSAKNYAPGTVLVYDYDDSPAPPEMAPHREKPILLTTGYNPTGVAAYRTRNDRELIFVTQSGGLSGVLSILTESYIDVIDAETVRTVATIPMGFAGLSFDGLVFDPGKRVGLIGSWTLRVMYAIDLSVFDDEALYQQSEIVLLDGTDTQFPDVRIFEADSPFVVPDRPDGPFDFSCRGWTYTDFNEAGEKAFVLDRCDGSLTSVTLLEPLSACEPSDPDPTACCDRIPLPASCFSVAGTENVTDSFTAVSERHGPSQIRVRRGEPGIDYSGPDVFFLVDLEDGQLCSARIDSQEP